MFKWIQKLNGKFTNNFVALKNVSKALYLLSNNVSCFALYVRFLVEKVDS